MKKKGAYELSIKIKSKYDDMLEKYKVIRGKNIKIHEDLKKYLVRVEGFHSATKTVGRIDDIEKANADMLWRKMQPVQIYLERFNKRHLEFINSKEVEDFDDLVYDGFIERINKVTIRIVNSNIAVDHAKKLLFPYDAELDEIIRRMIAYDKVIDEYISEFNDIVRVAGLQEN